VHIEYEDGSSIDTPDDQNVDVQTAADGSITGYLVDVPEHTVMINGADVVVPAETVAVAVGTGEGDHTPVAFVATDDGEVVAGTDPNAVS
jgi:hypothetical protein